jgi:hypothetical protein
MKADPELIVIVRPEVGLRASAVGVTARAADISPLADALASANARLRPLFGTSEDRLQSERATTAAVTGVEPPDLSVYYRVEAPAADLERLAERLRATGAVHAAYVKPPAELPQALNDMLPRAEQPPNHTPDFNARQAYLDIAPGGIDARYAWTQAGGDGTGVQIIDVEGAWRFSHEDLLANQGGVIGGTPSTDIGWRNHGTAVTGEFGGDAGTFGVTGICPQANVRAISIFGPGQGSAQAIRQAANALGPGDIVLIELHRPGPHATGVGQVGFIAVEWWPDDFDAVQFATSRGVIVVEAAGNGAENLDDAIYNTPAAGFPADWTNPFNRANRDSGAIIVGAGAPPPGTHGRTWGPDRSRLDFSNYGASVDAQGWGREVTTCGYGDLQGGLSEDEWYSDQFSGTSSASPIVVGAIGSLQGVVRARGLAPLTPARARQLLRATGSPQQDAPGRPATERIGNRPDLRQLIAQATKTKEKIEKIERKELKREKIEKPEFKEQKREKIEKPEFKEQKREKVEKPEFKEQKREKIEKPEFKELKPEKFESEGKGFFEGKGIFEGKGLREIGPEMADEPLAERLTRLEAAFDHLAHFIGSDLRPDLGAAALAGEADLSELSKQLAKQAADAKQAKDDKDVEKLVER